MGRGGAEGTQGNRLTVQQMTMTTIIDSVCGVKTGRAAPRASSGMPGHAPGLRRDG
ncbi:hypothetical protein GCM10010324_08400 [Streptomyces hiroshimensis]|uniref:Uncharacterized protein n=1 Tax=Streptomyces hiroshimensis TaxID=66424 RepID=A0ABQ2Y711_9ACTN|nr:hypothetical protein GCM10010324_08400 [Streptomyces hiroshimensis]